MTAQEILAPIEEKSALAALMQEYVAEMAQFVPGVRAGQSYPGFDLYWSEPEIRWPFWLIEDDRRTGFALLHRDNRRMDMAEFFVASPYRRRGIGLAAARRLIGRFPGPWSITQRETNPNAVVFWHRVLDGFVTYDETVKSTDAVRRQQLFTFP